MSDEFHDDEILLTFHKISSFSLLVMPAKLMIFNAIKPSCWPTTNSFFYCLEGSKWAPHLLEHHLYLYSILKNRTHPFFPTPKDLRVIQNRRGENLTITN